MVVPQLYIHGVYLSFGLVVQPSVQFDLILLMIENVCGLNDYGAQRIAFLL